MHGKRKREREGDGPGRQVVGEMAQSSLLLDLFHDQTKERILPFITWRISLLQLLTRMHHTDPQLNTTLSQVALERRLAAAETTHLEATARNSSLQA